MIRKAGMKQRIGGITENCSCLIVFNQETLQGEQGISAYNLLRECILQSERERERERGREKRWRGRLVQVR